MTAGTSRLLSCFLGGGAAATGAALIGAALDARSAARAAELPLTGLLPPAFGLWVPLAVVVGLVVGLGKAALLPPGAPARALAFLRGTGPSRHAALLALGPFALLLWLLVSARFALFALASELAPPVAGAVLALALALLGALFVLALLGLAELEWLAALAAVPRGACLSVASLAALALLAFGIATGPTGGGGGPLSALGVLRRDELDLRPVGLLLTLVVAALLAPAPRRARGIALALACLTLPFAVTVHAASRGLEAPKLALALERGAPLAGRLLPPLRKLADRDRDGFSALFGGGDCDEHDPGRSPAAEDVPGNGVDEDCSGSDAKLAAPAPAPAPPKDARAALGAALPERLNVILLSIDTLRYDLGYMGGGGRPISPQIDRLAAESVVFERAYALASYTAKSLPPMLIGKYSGETHRDYAHFNRFGKQDSFVAERLFAAGVQTVSVQGHWYFFQKFGMERGFERINSEAAPRAAQVEGDRSSNSDKLSDAAIAELARPELAAKPFFMWVHYTDPHAEYVRHEGFDFGNDSRALYDSEVAFVDHHVGRVLDALRQGSLWPRTAVILTSDHGEAFGEHGMIRHGFELWEELVRVPLLMRIPGVAPRRIAARRSLIDLVPTLLDLFRLPRPEGAGSDFVSGASWLADLALPPGAAPAERPIFADMSEGPHNAERRAFIERDVKLVTSRGRVLGLYDLAADPGEKRDLSDDRERAAQALEAYRAFQRGLREIVVRAPRSGAP